MKFNYRAIVSSKTFQPNSKTYLAAFGVISNAAALGAAGLHGFKYLTFVLLLPTALQAEESLAKRYGPLLTQCYAQAADAAAMKDCIGAMSGNCMAYEEQGETTYGMATCTSSETEVWDGFLNNEYRQTMAYMKALDKDEAEIFPEFANRADALKKAQRAWLVYRDATCDLEYALGGSGSIRQLYGAGCFLQMTAERTIELKQMREVGN